MKVRIGLASIGLLAVASSLAHAQAPTISSISPDGYLSWTNSAGTNAFALEWAPTPNGPWRSDWHDLNGIVTTSQVTTVRIPMFFRVKQGFSEPCMRGTWIFSDSSLTNAQYVVFDDAGNISDTSVLNTGNPAGRCAVDSSGLFSLEIFRPWQSGIHGIQTNQARFLDSGLVLLSTPSSEFFGSHSPLPFDVADSELRGWRVEDTSRCTGTWEGTHHYGLTNFVRVVVDTEGRISETAGLGWPVYHGRLFALTNGTVAGSLSSTSPSHIAFSGSLQEGRIQAWAWQYRSGPLPSFYGNLLLTNVVSFAP